MIEAALVFPILMVLLMGLLEYGWLFRQLQVITNAARHGARVGAAADAIPQDVIDAVDDRLDDAGITGGNTTVDFETETLEDGTTITLWKVTVNVTYLGENDLNMPLVPVPAMIQGKATMAKEDPQSPPPGG